MMPARLLWAGLVTTCLGSAMAQTVTQPQPEMSVQEAETVTLNCMYDTTDSNYYLFWYKQPPSGEMILIIRQDAYRQQNATDNRFSVNFQKAAKSFSLSISDSKLEDAAMYFCALMGHSEMSHRQRLSETSVLSTCVEVGTITQPQSEMSVQEAETVTLNCMYDTTDSNYYLFWYKQPPSREMILIIRQDAYRQQNAMDNRFSVNFQKAAKSFSLSISDSQLEDAAMYFCALMGHSEMSHRQRLSETSVLSTCVEVGVGGSGGGNRNIENH
ncbi:hypothetical protein MC885_020694 [Smutsia gigantea]|nr:hypothetical protein MC885_020694 [Smutsia gigantea]